MDVDKANRDLRASLNIIKANSELVHRGHADCYRVIAGELRKLLCDGRSTLAPKVLSDLQFHPLISRLRESGIVDPSHGLIVPASAVRFYMPGVLNFDGKGGCTAQVLFDERANAIPLESWLEQPLFQCKLTIRELIRSVADKEGVHSDAEYNETLQLTRSIILPNGEIHTKYILWIGEYVAKIIASRMN